LSLDKLRLVGISSESLDIALRLSKRMPEGCDAPTIVRHGGGEQLTQFTKEPLAIA